FGRSRSANGSKLLGCQIFTAWVASRGGNDCSSASRSSRCAHELPTTGRSATPESIQSLYNPPLSFRSSASLLHFVLPETLAQCVDPACEARHTGKIADLWLVLETGRPYGHYAGPARFGSAINSQHPDESPAMSVPAVLLPLFVLIVL